MWCDAKYSFPNVQCSRYLHPVCVDTRHYFHNGADYIFTLRLTFGNKVVTPYRITYSYRVSYFVPVIRQAVVNPRNTCSLLPCGIVVERSVYLVFTTILNCFAADHPISDIFKHSRSPFLATL